MTAAASDLLLAALELARLTGQTAMRHFRGAIAVERKGDGSPVTIADREAERAARDWIARRFPDDAILGEEFGETPGTSGRQWLLDPIDGTRTFVRGVPLWGSLIAVVGGDTVLAGAACYPAMGEEIAAAPGRGCWHNGARCAVSKVDRVIFSFWQFARAREQSDLLFKAAPPLQRVGLVLNGAPSRSRAAAETHDYALDRFANEADIAVDTSTTEGQERLRAVLAD